MREDARAHDDEDQPAQQGVERHAEEDQIDRLLGDAVGDRDARHERRERQHQRVELRGAGGRDAVDLRAADHGEENRRYDDRLE